MIEIFLFVKKTTRASIIVTQVVMISRVDLSMNNFMTSILIVCLIFFIKINDAKWMKKKKQQHCFTYFVVVDNSDRCRYLQLKNSTTRTDDEKLIEMKSTATGDVSNFFIFLSFHH